MSVNNIEKLLQYLNVVAKNPIRIIDKHGNEQVVGDKITAIKLNSTFFYSDSCNMCGGCCPAESNIYTQSEYDKIQSIKQEEYDIWNLNFHQNEKLSSNLYPQIVNINGKDIAVYQYDKEPNDMFLPVRNHELPRCTWCFQDNQGHYKCNIHPARSISCIMPHLRFFHRSGSNSTSMGLSQFGRNWLLGCSVKFTEPKSENEFETNKKNRIEKLKHLYQVGQDMNIDTYLLDVCEYIEKCDFEHYEEYLNNNCLEAHHKLF